MRRPAAQTQEAPRQATSRANRGAAAATSRHRRAAWRSSIAAPLLAACLATPALAAAPLAAHHAVYKLTLDNDRPGSMVAATGSMVYDVSDSCDGWATRQRLQMHLTNGDGQTIEMLSDYATWEAKDGKSFDFHMKQMTDTAVTDQVDGHATMAPTGGSIHYTAPEDKTTPLQAGTLFPMAHTARLIAAAEAGQKFAGIPLFDGTGADGAQDTFVTVLNWGKPNEAPFPDLAGLPAGRVHITFFSREKGSQTPDYEITMKYWENGVADELRMNFGDFVMDGQLSDFTLPIPAHC